jgi:hypothetical protein
MMQRANVILYDVWTMFWTPCDRRQPAESEGHFCCAGTETKGLGAAATGRATADLGGDGERRLQ